MPPARVLARLRRATRLRARLGPPLAACAAGAALVAALWAGAAALAAARVRADETTLLAAVWASRPAVAAWQAEGIPGGPWPGSARGAGLVCRMRSGQWLVSVLVHNVPRGGVLHEEIAVGGRRLMRTLRPIGDTVLAIAPVPVADGPVRWVRLWERGAGASVPLMAWRVTLATARSAPGPEPSPGWAT